MVGAGQGIGVAREIEDHPIWISFSYGERGARTCRIWMGKDPPSTTGAPLAYLRSTAEEGVEVDFPEIDKSDGTARAHLKDIDFMKGGFLAREFEGKFSKMDFEEMKRIHLKDIDFMKGEFLAREFEDKFYKMDFEEMKRAHLKDIDFMKGGFLAREFEAKFSRMDFEEMKRAHLKDIDFMNGGFLAREFEDKFSKMDFEEMKRTYMKDIGIIDDGTFSWEFEDIVSKMDVREMKSAYMRANGMLLTNALTPITRRSSANSTGDYYLYLDSGASRHMVFDPALLINLRDPPSGTGQFRAADGSLLSVAAYGDIVMENFRIPDVYLVEELTVNLISVGQLASNHKVSSCFAGNECNLMLSGGEQIGGAIRRDDNQYILRFLEIE